MEAVAYVILDRAKAWYSHLADPIYQAVYAKNQFTSMSVPSDPEFNLQPKLIDAQCAHCTWLCTSLLSGEPMAHNPAQIDPTRRSLLCEPR
jgi:hypothetical protein